MPRHHTNRPRVKFHAHNTSNPSECHVSGSIPLSPQLPPKSSPTPHFRTMPPHKKPAAVIKKPVASPPLTSKVQKRGPSNADKMASKPKAKKAKNAKKTAADDNDGDTTMGIQGRRLYFLVPHRFHPESGNSAGIYQNPQEWHRNPQESTGMAPESAGMALE